jgi:hypothetical protein
MGSTPKKRELERVIEDFLATADPSACGTFEVPDHVVEAMIELECLRADESESTYR